MVYVYRATNDGTGVTQKRVFVWCILCHGYPYWQATCMRRVLILWLLCTYLMNRQPVWWVLSRIQRMWWSHMVDRSVCKSIYQHTQNCERESVLKGGVRWWEWWYLYHKSWDTLFTFGNEHWIDGKRACGCVAGVTLCGVFDCCWMEVYMRGAKVAYG